MKLFRDKGEDKRIRRRERSFIISYIEENKAYVTDISDTGCKFFWEEGKENPSQIEAGVQLDLKLEMPGYYKKTLKYVHIPAKVVWLSQEDKCVFGGAEFPGELSDDLRDNIRQIVWHWNFLNSTFGSFMR